MLKRLLTASCLFALGIPVLLAQSLPTAKRRADLQIGGGFVIDNSDYDPTNLKGFAFYTTLDLTNHYGGEFVIHQANSGTGDKLYERTYEIGPRYYRHYGRFAPYIKGMYGRGVFNYPEVPSLTPGGPPQGAAANLAYNIAAVGVGVDYRLTRSVNLRVEYEFQKWFGFPPNDLTPQVLAIGAAYRFH